MGVRDFQELAAAVNPVQHAQIELGSVAHDEILDRSGIRAAETVHAPPSERRPIVRGEREVQIGAENYTEPECNKSVDKVDDIYRSRIPVGSRPMIIDYQSGWTRALQKCRQSGAGLGGSWSAGR